MRNVIAISVGDPGGIGPEIIVKSFRDSDLFAHCTPVVFTPENLFLEALKTYAPSLRASVIESEAAIEDGVFNIHAIGGGAAEFPIGAASADAGRASMDAIAEGVKWCMDGRAIALVTAPISKESLGMSGSPYKGHTEYIRDLTGSNQVLMVLASPSMRVGLCTVHIPLSAVASQVTGDTLTRTIRMANTALVEDFGIVSPRIAVLGLNPHAGDGGYLGREEQELIIPALNRLRNEGLALDGPFPADAYFAAHGTRHHDMIIAMYHDQGLIPLKMSAGGRAVNISCGLPIIRTSPDHGTAFDIAGKDLADPGSFIEAVRCALDIGRNRAELMKESPHD